ncbi:MAG: beta-N-acetylhexosaminidase [Bdellovibrio sp.]
MRSKLGQLFFIGISGPSLTKDERKFIIENNIGGVVLFSRNVSSPEQVHALCTELQALRHDMPDKAPLFIAIDMEGGRVARLKAPFTLWPPLKHLGDIDSPTLSFHFAQSMGAELRAVGLNLDFAPCVDTFTNPLNTVIGDRAISTDPEMVAKHATALVRGYMKAGVVPCAKHFPGHGHTLIDSHYDLPVEEADLARLQSVELKPFAKSFRARVPMVMTGHISFPNVDPEWPVTLSEIFLKKIARQDMRYKGLIITDDLDMEALSKHYDAEKVPVRSLQAGADILLYCNEPTSPPKAFAGVEKALKDKTLDWSYIDAVHERVLETKRELLANPDPMPLAEALRLVGHPEHQRLSQAMRNNEVPEGLVFSES